MYFTCIPVLSCLYFLETCIDTWFRLLNISTPFHNLQVPSPLLSVPRLGTKNPITRSTTHMGSVLVSALEPNAACREQAIRLITRILQQQRHDAMGRNVVGGKASHSSAVVGVSPQVLHENFTLGRPQGEANDN